MLLSAHTSGGYIIIQYTRHKQFTQRLVFSLYMLVCFGSLLNEDALAIPLPISLVKQKEG